MAKGDTKTNQYLDIAANGTRADLPTDTCCETRSQTLIREVAERIMDVEDEVEEIKNNPDVVDIVPTYAALQNYDTSGLTDKDIIRVLADETHDGDSTYYRYNAQSGTWTYVGESKQYEDFVGTDGTTAGEAGLVPAPATTDAGKFLSASGLWEEVAGGGITELTSADYNYPAANPTGVAMWLLDAGVYLVARGVRIYREANSYNDYVTWAVVSNKPYDLIATKSITVFFDSPDLSNTNPRCWGIMTNTNANGSNTGFSYYIDKLPITNLTSTSNQDYLSAYQGKVLNDKIGGDLSNLTTTDKTSIINAINEVAGQSGGGVTELTSADYNWNSISGESGTPDTIAVWKLDAGVYSWDELVHITDYSGTGYTTEAGICVVSTSSSSNAKIIIKWTRNGTTRFIVDNPTTGESIIWKFMLSSTSTKDNLTSTSTTEPLSANQGKVLKDLIDSIAIRGAGAPTTSTVGEVGQLYEDGTNGALYQLKSIDITVTPNTYNWEQVGAGGGSGPTVVQTTGTSTTDVMSQNATTSMVFADPSTKYRVQIGAGASTNADTISIGHEAHSNGWFATALGAYKTSANYRGSTALGSFAAAMEIGEMNIGLPLATGIQQRDYGYRQSAYRLLTGLYDPQSAHDAATKGYVDPTTDSSAPTTATVGRLGQIQIDTTTATAYMCVAVDTVTPAYTWKQITA